MTEEQKAILTQYREFKDLVGFYAWESYVAFVRKMVEQTRTGRADIPITGLDKALESEYLRGYANGLAAAVAIPEASLDELGSIVDDILAETQEIEDE